jgi:hypothetical protein
MTEVIVQTVVKVILSDRVFLNCASDAGGFEIRSILSLVSDLRS